MKGILLYVLMAVIGLIISIGISYSFGWISVHQTQTIGKARQNAERQVFEQSQSFVEGKRQEASKLYYEWKRSDSDSKRIIESTVRNSFSNFDETLLNPELERFIYNCKY